MEYYTLNQPMFIFSHNFWTSLYQDIYHHSWTFWQRMLKLDNHNQQVQKKAGTEQKLLSQEGPLFNSVQHNKTLNLMKL